MKKNILLVIIIIILLSSCKLHPVEYKKITTYNKLYKTNVVGIVGESSETPYIEIIYSVADGENNKTERLMVSPPYLFQSDKVNIRCDSAITVHGDDVLAYILTLKHDYSEGGAEHFQIINHSSNKSVEYFVVGAQDLVLSKNSEERWIEILPSLFYKKAPLYYLLFPERKFGKNGKYRGEVFHFEGDRCGDLVLTEAWSAEEVAKLFRAEYRNSPDTILYLDGSYFDKRLYRLVNADEKEISNVSHIAGKKFYGHIAPQDTLKADKDFWLIATPWMFDETMTYTRF